MHDEGGSGGGVAQHGGHTPANRLTEPCICRRMPSFLGRIFKEKNSFQQKIVEVDLTFLR